MVLVNGEKKPFFIFNDPFLRRTATEIMIPSSREGATPSRFGDFPIESGI
jgi:hypothetical protein